MNTTADASLRDARARLANAGVEGPDAELLLGHALGIDRSAVRLRVATAAEITHDEAQRYVSLIDRRVRREPLQHITGVAHFRHLDLEVGPGVFIPRPETEVLVDAVLRRLRPGSVVVDAGTGSGAIAISIATEADDVSVVAIERSADALQYTRRNIARFAPQIRLVEADLGDERPELRRKVDALVSNPPYVPVDAVPRDVEVRLYDPALALYSGSDGLDAIRVLAKRGLEMVKPGGFLAIEHGEIQAAAVRAVLSDHGWASPETETDLTGRDRITIATR